MSFSKDSLKYKEQFISQADTVSKTDDYFIKTYVKNENAGSASVGFSGNFTPGKIYIFNYNKSAEENDGKFVSKIPVVLALNFLKNKNGSQLYGIDLVTVPPSERMSILERIYDYLVTKDWNPASLGKDNVGKLLNGTGYKSSCFYYSAKRISEISEVQNADWHKLPFASFALLEGSTPIKIYSDYRSKLK